jgi:sugar lactone lactonase YvrE
MKKMDTLVISLSLTLFLSQNTIAQQTHNVKHFTLGELPTRAINKLSTWKMIFKKGAKTPVDYYINQQYSAITQESVNVVVVVDEKPYLGAPLRFTALEDKASDTAFFSSARFDRITSTLKYYDKRTKTGVEHSNSDEAVTSDTFATVKEAVGNIAFTPNGELIYSHHPFFSPENKVVKYDATTKTVAPFPNKAWNTPSKANDQYLSSVLGIRNDSNGIIWMLDMGLRDNITPKIVGWNMYKNQLEKIYYIPAPATTPTSQHNDMVVDLKHQVFVIADEGIANGGDGSKAALVTVDMKTGKTRRLLQGHYSTMAENTPITIDKKILSVEGKPLLVGADGITADAENIWLYYAPLNGSKIYRIKIEDLINEELSETALSKKVETYSKKPNNGGLSIDKDNNLYLTALETKSIAIVLAKDRSVHSYTADDHMLWPDGITYNAKDGYMYVSAAQVHLGAVFNYGINKSTKPFYIFRFKPVAEGISGR